MIEPDGLRMQPRRSPGFSGANPNNCECHRQAYDESAGNGQNECEQRICLRAHIVCRHVACSIARINPEAATGRSGGGFQFSRSVQKVRSDAAWIWLTEG